MIDTKGVKFVNNLTALIKKKTAEFKENGENASQARIAVDLGIDPATLSLYKNDKVKHIDIDLWRRMADYFGVEGHEIFTVKQSKSFNRAKRNG